MAVKWAIIPLEVLMDEQFLKVLHSIEEITDTTPLRDAAKQLPKQIYNIIQSQEQTNDKNFCRTNRSISV